MFKLRNPWILVPFLLVLSQDVTCQEKIDVAVKLRITGLAHLVGKNGTKTRLLVIPNAQTANHVPLLLAPAAFNPKGLDEHPRKQNTSQITFHWRKLPAGYEIDLERSGWIRPGTPKLELSEEGDGDPDAQCPKGNGGTVEPTSLHWLPRLSTVTGTGAPFKLKDDFTKKDPTPEHVAVRLEIVDGQLDAAMPLSPDKFAFRVGASGDDHIQAVAEYLDYSFTVKLDAGTPMKLVGRKFGSTTDFVTLGTFEPNANKKIEIYLANVVVDDFFVAQKRDEIPHFHHYYDIVAERVTPALTERLNACGGGVGGNVECGPDRP